MDCLFIEVMSKTILTSQNLHTGEVQVLRHKVSCALKSRRTSRSWYALDNRTKCPPKLLSRICRGKQYHVMPGRYQSAIDAVLTGDHISH